MRKRLCDVVFSCPLLLAAAALDRWRKLCGLQFKDPLEGDTYASRDESLELVAKIAWV